MQPSPIRYFAYVVNVFPCPGAALVALPAKVAQTAIRTQCEVLRPDWTSLGACRNLAVLSKAENWCQGQLARATSPRVPTTKSRCERRMVILGVLEWEGAAAASWYNVTKTVRAVLLPRQAGERRRVADGLAAEESHCRLKRWIMSIGYIVQECRGGASSFLHVRSACEWALRRVKWFDISTVSYRSTTDGVTDAGTELLTCNCFSMLSLTRDLIKKTQEADPSGSAVKIKPLTVCFWSDFMANPSIMYELFAANSRKLDYDPDKVKVMGTKDGMIRYVTCSARHSRGLVSSL